MKQRAIKRLEKLEAVTGVRDQIIHLRIQGVSRDKDGKMVTTEGGLITIGEGRKEAISPLFVNEEKDEKT